MDRTLRILHAPCYAPKVHLGAIFTAERTKADSIGYSELYRVAHLVGHHPTRYQGVVGHSDVDTRFVDSPRGDAGDNPIAVRGDHRILGANIVKLTKPGRPLKYAPERWGKAVRYRWTDEVVCHIDVHPSPKFTSLAKWARVMRWAAKQVRDAQARGELVVLTGDLQTRRTATLLLRRLGLKVWRERIDFIAHDPRLQKQASSHVIQVPTSDHPWMLAEFKLAR